MVRNLRSNICSEPNCKVRYWKKIVESGEWEKCATSCEDARMALGSAELVCGTFHRRASKEIASESKLTSLTSDVLDRMEALRLAVHDRTFTVANLPDELEAFFQIWCEHAEALIAIARSTKFVVNKPSKP